MRTNIILAVALLFSMSLVAQSKKAVSSSTRKKPAVPVVIRALPTRKMVTLPQETRVEIETNYGTMVARLYNTTPKHRDNFIKLVQQGFYDSLLFHRVIGQFMIQGGDPNSKQATAEQMLGNGALPGERIPAELSPTFFHKKGALAAARDNNPEKASSNCQFYIVQGKVQTDEDMDGLKQKNQLAVYSNGQAEIYKRIGGVPFLDQNYTVFGEVISGLEVIDRIAQLQTGPNNRPVENVVMKMRLLN